LILAKKVFGILMVVLFLGGGATIIFSASDEGNIPKDNARLMGALLVVYGLYRAYTVYKNYFASDDK